MNNNAFTMTPGWLCFHPNPSVPRFRAPAGAVDAHCHVFGPGAKFPYAPERKYTPCDATCEQLFALRDRLGFERNVIVQATCHGADNRALVDALRRSAGHGARASQRCKRSISDAGTAGAARGRGARRALQLRQAPRGLHAQAKSCSRSPRRIAPLGWHVVMYFEAVDLPEL